MRADNASFLLPPKPRRDQYGRALPEARIATCKRGHETTHEYVWLESMTWQVTCTQCRAERQRLEAET